MSAISVLLEALVDFEDNNPGSAEKPSEVMDLAQDGTADNPVHFKAVPLPLNLMTATVRILLCMKKIHGHRKELAKNCRQT